MFKVSICLCINISNKALLIRLVSQKDDCHSIWTRLPDLMVIFNSVLLVKIKIHLKCHGELLKIKNIRAWYI
eukprot:snap_masked-scaffold_18-processed-gene-6.53-mRNA-1 protein AED:1.00 eAED:1.00 QI:0/0/0/0/1/1/2/0/71